MMISAYCLIPIGLFIGLLIGWIVSVNAEKNEYRGELMKMELRYWKKKCDIELLEKRLAEKCKTEKHPMKMTIDVELNTEQLTVEIDKIKHIIGICKHQDKCAFFEVGGDNKNDLR